MLATLINFQRITSFRSTNLSCLHFLSKGRKQHKFNFDEQKYQEQATGYANVNGVSQLRFELCQNMKQWCADWQAKQHTFQHCRF